MIWQELKTTSPSGENRRAKRSSRRQANFWPVAPGIIQQGLVVLIPLMFLAGCAMQSDRTRELLEMDLADRDRAIATLETEYRTEPSAWNAYTVGVLKGADEDFTAMNEWFQRSLDQSDYYAENISNQRAVFWRDWAKRGDKQIAEGRFDRAVVSLNKALEADPGRTETRARLIEARILADGPTAELWGELPVGSRPAVLDRWLESVANSRAAARAQLEPLAETDALLAFAAGELARMDGQYAVMGRYYLRVGASSPYAGLVTEQRRNVTQRMKAEAMRSWTAGYPELALARLDTAAVVLPGDLETRQIRNVITRLETVGPNDDIGALLSADPLDSLWMDAWMSRLQSAGRTGQAGQVAQVYLETDPETTPQSEARARRLVVTAAIEAGDLPTATTNLIALFESGQATAEEAVVLGDILVGQSRYEKARTWFDTAASMGYPEAPLEIRQARIAFSQNRTADMLRHAETAVRLAPDDPVARELLNRALVLSGGQPLRFSQVSKEGDR